MSTIHEADDPSGFDVDDRVRQLYTRQEGKVIGHYQPAAVRLVVVHWDGESEPEVHDGELPDALVHLSRGSKEKTS